MSMGPSLPIQEENTSAKAVRAIRQAVIAFSTRPSYTLFYAGLAAIFIGALLGNDIPMICYYILVLLGIIELSTSRKKKLDQK